jgi:hypothetical protein
MENDTTSEAETRAAQKVRLAKRLGSGFFIMLAVVNIAVGHGFKWPDFALLAFVSLPLIVNRRWLFFVFGTLCILATLYIGIAYLMLDSMARHTDAEPRPLLMDIASYGIILLSLTSSLLLIYASLSVSEKRFSFF